MKISYPQMISKASSKIRTLMQCSLLFPFAQLDNLSTNKRKRYSILMNNWIGIWVFLKKGQMWLEYLLHALNMSVFWQHSFLWSLVIYQLPSLLSCLKFSHKGTNFLPQAHHYLLSNSSGMTSRDQIWMIQSFCSSMLWSSLLLKQINTEHHLSIKEIFLTFLFHFLSAMLRKPHSRAFDHNILVLTSNLVWGLNLEVWGLVFKNLIGLIIKQKENRLRTFGLN